MKTKTKLTPLQVVERYYNRYIEFETAFNKKVLNDNETNKKILDIVDKGIKFDSEEFENNVLDLIISKEMKRSDVTTAAMTFMMFTKFYLLTESEDLPKELKEEYNKLQKVHDNISFYSIENGDFVLKEKDSLKVDKNQLQFIYNQIKTLKELQNE